jgi:hypothetical protein
MEADQTTPPTQQPVDQETPAPVKSEPSPIEKFRQLIAAGPLPATASRIDVSYRTHRKQIWISLVIVILFIAIAIGLGFGERIARFFRPEQLQVPDLPRVTPTPAPLVSTSFDQLRERVGAFSGSLPEPAPPAVDHNISLQN